jgi:hypothetical protein
MEQSFILKKLIWKNRLAKKNGTNKKKRLNIESKRVLKAENFLEDN